MASASNPDYTSGAYALLNKPTTELTPEDEKAIFANLRLRREQFLQGQQDAPARKRAPTKTPEEKAAVTANLLDGLLNQTIGDKP